MVKHNWYNCYSGGWSQQDITPAAFSHPAKFAKGLIQRIYDHLLTEGYIQAGDTVADPFGGVGLGALFAMRNGLHWTGVELEPRFVELGNENIELWSGRFAPHFPGWGTARLVQGDSRRLVEILGGAGCVVSSPPYAVNTVHGGSGLKQHKDNNKGIFDYGFTPGQLGNMPEGSYTAVVSSPAYGDSVNGVGEGPGARFDSVYHNGENATKKSSANGYGVTDGQLGRLAAVVGSPPFEKQNAGGGISAAMRGESNGYNLSPKVKQRMETNYVSTPGYMNQGETAGQLAQETGGDFWSAAKTILSQCYQILRPGGVAAFVTGNYRRNGEIVPFGEQWLALCESVGFVGLEHITAWKVERRPGQVDIFGKVHNRDISRVSFFRRLDNQKNVGAEIESEEVWIVQKPSPQAQP